jgi:cyclophilin family peptidyl-prolyl cis-trans isomerase
MVFNWLRWLSRRKAPSARRLRERRRPTLRHLWRFEVLEDRLTPSSIFTGGVSVAAGDVEADNIPDIVTGAGAGSTPLVQVISGATGGLARSFLAYDSSFTGGVNVATGDFNGDGNADIVTGPGPGAAPLIKVFSGKDGSLLLSFMAYDASMTGGVNVAVGDIEGTGTPDIITAPASNAYSNVKIFSGKDGSLVKSFFAYDGGFKGGVSVAAGDIFGNGKVDVVTAAGTGGGPHVKVYTGVRSNETLAAPLQFMAYSPTFTGGVHVAVGDVLGNSANQIITGAGTGGGPHVEVFDQFASVQRSFMAYDPSFRGGVNVADLGATNIVTGAGPGGGPHVEMFRGNDLSLATSFMPYGQVVLPGGQFSQPFVPVTKPTFDLDPNSDTGPKGDQRTSLDTVNLIGTTSPNARVTLTPGNTTVMADSNGKFTFTGVSLALGSNAFTATAQDLNGNKAGFSLTILRTHAPTVASQIADISVFRNAMPGDVDLYTHFANVDGLNTQLRLNTNQGAVDIELYDMRTPKTVDNFLNYVSTGKYNNDIFHRLAINPDGSKFVLQGGGFTFSANPSNITSVTTGASVMNEPGISNTRGTVAMAKLGNDPNSATSQFFFNLSDNSSNLDNQNGGFTVFATVINNTMTVVDQMANATIKDESRFNSALNTIPLINYNGNNFPTDTTVANFEAINTVTFLRQNLTYSVSSSNPGLVTATLNGTHVALNYQAGQGGTATITVTATNQEGQAVTTTFNVTVS